jgi:PAS domain S-box-containing protein
MAKILVVEDESIVAWDIKETLEKLGHTVVDLVGSGTEAICSAVTASPDLVLMDIRLSGDMDGITAGNEIYLQFKIPVVYLTAHADEFTLDRAIKTNPFGYIIKPFQAQSLNSTIQIALQRHQLEVSAYMTKVCLENALNINSIGSGVIATDRQGIVTFMNPIAENITGWYSQVAIGKDISQIFRLIWETDSTEIENPSSRAMRSNAPIKSPEFCWLVAKDGTTIPIADVATPIVKPNGEIVGSIVIFQDNTKRLSTQMDLRERNQDLEFFQLNLSSQLQAKTVEYQQAIACIQVLDLVLDRVRTFKTERELLQMAISQFSIAIDANYAWIALHDSQSATAKISCEYINPERLHPISKIDKEIDTLLYSRFYNHLFTGESWIAPPVEIIPQLYLDLLTPTTQLSIFPLSIGATANRSLQQSDLMTGEIGILTTGKPLWTTAKTSPISQTLSCAVKLFYQIHTESISISLEWLDNLKDDLLTSIADLRRDLTVNAHAIQQIQSLDREPEDLATVLARQSLHQELAVNLATLQSEWQRQFRLIDMLIDIRRNGAIAQRLNLSDLLFYKWAIDVIKNCSEIATQFELKFSYCITDRLPQILLCPFPAIELIVVELCHQACKYTPRNCPMILDIEIRADRLEFSIIGLEIEIPIWNLEAIFFCFTKEALDLSLRSNCPSLGLALVHQLLVDLDSTIGVASDNNSTRVILSIPILVPDRSN